MKNCKGRRTIEASRSALAGRSELGPHEASRNTTRARRVRSYDAMNPERPMKIATFNVNGVNGRLPVLLRWLAEFKPDIACLQELKTSDEKFPADAIRTAGYAAIWHGQKSYNGVAILSRVGEPVERRRGLPGDPQDAQSRYIEAQIGKLTVGCLY